MKPFIRSAHNYDMRIASRSSATVNDEPSLTVQSQKDEADINVLVRRFGLTGQILGVPRPPLEGDFSAEAFDFQSSMNLIRSAQESFDAMSAVTRERFANDPARFVNFCSDPSNLEEMRKMGLAIPEAKPQPPPEPTLVRIVPEPAPKP